MRSDKVLMAQLVNQAAGTVNGNPSGPNWLDLSAYSAGAFYLVVTAIGGGSITPSFQMSPDNGATIIGTIPTAELAAPTAVSATGATRYPFVSSAAANPPGLEWPWVRVVNTIVTGPVTANVYFIGRA
jgi:hypothetical protein